MKINKYQASMIVAGNDVDGIQIVYQGDWFENGDFMFRETVVERIGSYFMLEECRDENGKRLRELDEENDLVPVRRVETETQIYYEEFQ